MFVVFDIKYLTGIQHVYDESGYWSAAAFLLDLDWKDLTSYNLYYSYGYGIILAIIMKFFPEVNLYQIAVIVNAFILSVELYIIYYSLKRILKEFSAYTIIGLSFILTIYPYNMFYAHLTISEVLLSFLFWVIIFLYIKLLESDDLLSWFLLGGVVSFSYTVHQRFIGILLTVVIMTFLLVLSQKKQVKNLLFLLLFLLLFYLVGNFIKKDYVNSWFSASSSVSTNDYSGQSGKISLAFSLQGIPYLFSSIIGKWFGICASTFMLVSFGMFGVIKDSISGMVRWKKDKQFDKQAMIKMFFCLCFFAEFGINVIFLIYPENYADYLIYTRYTDTVVLPLIALGLYRFYMKDISWKEVAINIIVFVVALIWVLIRIWQTGLNEYVGQANVGIWDLYSTGMSIECFMCQAALRAIVVCLLLYIFLNLKNYRCWSLIALGVLWLYIGKAAYQKDNTSRINNNIKEIADVVFELDNIDKLYYYVGEEEKVSLNVFYIQLQNPNSVIQIVKSWSEVEELKCGSYIITNSINDLEREFLIETDIIDRNNNFTLLEKK